jgi:hypothetical protein
MASTWTAVMSERTAPASHRGPGGIGVEPEDVHRDMPSLRDLYPSASPFAGPPVF